MNVFLSTVKRIYVAAYPDKTCIIFYHLKGDKISVLVKILFCIIAMIQILIHIILFHFLLPRENLM